MIQQHGSTVYALALWLLTAPFALAKESGVIDDPSGYVNVLVDKQADASIIANVKTGERVSFECDEGDKWCKVKLRSGKSGWMHFSRIRLFFGAPGETWEVER